MKEYKLKELLSVGEVSKILGVCVKKVNPAYTSILGKTHYAASKGLSNHQAASYVIARRFYEFKERIKKEITIQRKGRVFTLVVPDGKQKLYSFSKWLSGEMMKSHFTSNAKHYVSHAKSRRLNCESIGI